jgi:hypothetical protein
MESKNGEPRFEVRFSKKLANEIKSIILNSKRKAEIIASFERVQARLERDPWNFGEQCYHLYHGRMQIRLAVVGPLAVEYAVEMDRPRVVIKRFVELGNN